MKPEYAACAEGKEQSPIDITGAVRAKLPPISYDYKPSALRVLDNGHTLQVGYDPGSGIRFGDARYELLQFHFHKPSEERVNGKPYELVAHLVHKNAEGRLAVVAVLFREGAENPFLKTVFSHLPAGPGQEKVAEGVTVAARDLLPAGKSYWNFPGSLTTPPCSEGVNWIVLQTPVTASAEQIATFGARYPMNARPVQPLNDRVVKSSR